MSDTPTVGPGQRTDVVGVEQGLSGYPGRGLVYATESDGAAWWMYFVTGRSPSSRDRRIRIESGALVVAPLDHQVDPDVLRHYTCARRSRDAFVIGNGDHVDEIAAGLDDGRTLDQLLEEVEPEPDPPVWTPRIAMVLGDHAVMVSVHRRPDGTVRRVHRPPKRPGAAAILTTYSGSTNAVVADAPYTEVGDSRPADELAEALFERLDDRLRVCLVAGPITPEGSTVEPEIQLPRSAES